MILLFLVTGSPLCIIWALAILVVLAIHEFLQSEQKEPGGPR